MSAPIHSLLADELDLPDAKAKKLLGAMLREVRKRARQGVRLPDLGKFSEENGTLVFEPSESLARAVNHRFEGLDTEDLGSAPDTTAETNTDDSDGGPDTITLGYQESSNWSPIDGEDDEEETDQTSDEPDTAEFEVPSAEEAADTEELQTSSTEPSDAPSDPPSDPSSDVSSTEGEGNRTETEELYPLVEDMPSGPDEEDASSPPDSSTPSDEEYDEERDSLSGIWGSEEEQSETEAAPSSPFEEEPEPASASDEDLDPFSDSDTSEDAPATKHVDQSPPTSDSDPFSDPEPAPDPEPTPDAPEEPQPAPPASEEPTDDTETTSTTLRVLTSLLILLLVGGGAWYILGQQGMVPGPGTTFAQLQSSSQGTTAQPNASSSTGTTNSSSGQTPETSASEEAETTANTDNAESTAPSASSDSPSDETTATTDASPRLDPAAGGWTIIVASRTQQAPARTLASDFRQRFGDQQTPVGVLSGNVENTTRYRVGVGQFDSREAAQQFLDQHGSKLPDGAWPLRLQ